MDENNYTIRHVRKMKKHLIASSLQSSWKYVRKSNLLNIKRTMDSCMQQLIACNHKFIGCKRQDFLQCHWFSIVGLNECDNIPILKITPPFPLVYSMDNRNKLHVNWQINLGHIPLLILDMNIWFGNVSQCICNMMGFVCCCISSSTSFEMLPNLHVIMSLLISLSKYVT